MDTAALFTLALGIESPWEVTHVELSTETKRIDFQIACNTQKLPCPLCNTLSSIHDRQARTWRHLNFFEYQAFIHANVPRVECQSCRQTTQMPVPWARAKSGFTLAFEALAITLCQTLPMTQAAKMLAVTDKHLLRQITHYVETAREKENYADVTLIGIDETSTRKGHNYITVVHDLANKRLIYATEGKDNQTVQQFAADFKAHGGDTDKIEHACIDMSSAYIKGVTEALPKAAINFDTFHVVQLVGKAMEQVRRAELSPAARKKNKPNIAPELIKPLLWGMRKNFEDWDQETIDAMHHFQRSDLKSARAWRLKEAFRRVCREARQTNAKQEIEVKMKAWISWARRSRLEPFKQVALTLKTHFDAIVRGLLDNRSNAYVEAMNGLLQQAKRAARGYRNVKTFIMIAYLRMSKLKDLPKNPMYI